MTSRLVSAIWPRAGYGRVMGAARIGVGFAWICHQRHHLEVLGAAASLGADVRGVASSSARRAAQPRRRHQMPLRAPQRAPKRRWRSGRPRKAFKKRRRPLSATERVDCNAERAPIMFPRTKCVAGFHIPESPTRPRCRPRGQAGINQVTIPRGRECRRLLVLRILEAHCAVHAGSVGFAG